MKVSIITAVFNNKSCIEACLQSVLGQTHQNKEHIVVDGGSSDGTVDVIRKYGDRISIWISGPDKGIYDALNKGLGMATGDVIGILHSDDLYAKGDVIETVVSRMKDCNKDVCYGDLLYVERHDTDKVIRYWKSGPYREGLFEKGWMPPHPTFIVKRELYERYGRFNADFRISADYELMLRFMVRHKVSSHYISEVLVKMRTGGASNKSLTNLLTKTAEDYRAWRVNNLRRNFYTIPFKNLSKIPQFFKKW